MIVISNTSPIHYLILIHAEQILPRLYGKVVVPVEVLRELEAENAPETLRIWTKSPPSWLEVRPAPPYAVSDKVHAGEAAAIALAKELRADLLLMDDRDARAFAEEQGLRVAGTLGVLRDAADQRLVDLEVALAQLRKTNFRAPQSLFDDLLRDFHT